MAKSKPLQPVIGIDVGGTNITAGLVDGKNKVSVREKTDTEADQGAAHVIDRIAACIEQLIKDAKCSRDEIAGVGLGVPGAVDASRGAVLEAVNLRWKNVPAATAVAKKVNLPVTLDNDVNVGTWGAYRLGAAQGARSVFGIFVGTGVGGGFVIDGQLMHGVYGTAGEVGHMVINAYGPHGLRTLEQLASRTAVVNRLIQMINANHPSELPQLAGKRWPRIRSKVLARAYEGKDALTVGVVNDAARAVGIAIANVVTLLSIDCVVVGGGVTEALGEKWVSEIRAAFSAAVFPEACRKCKVVPSTLEDDAGIIGAALLARERLA